MIQTERGNIWDCESTHLLVIPTNIGYKADGRNVMGRGLALQAAKRHREFALWYGRICQDKGAKTPVVRFGKTALIAFPVKPLNPNAPWLSWKSHADLSLIERSVRQLSQFPGKEPIMVPLVGCGNGQLDMGEVRPILDRYLSDERYTLILPKN